MAKLDHLEPTTVWKHFEAICGIPHPSGHEEAFANYVESEAKRLGHGVARDGAGNVVVTQPASAGCENAPTVVLQGHLDMVGVAVDGKDHDFVRDPIPVFIDGDYIRADGTTLGADNGIGGAMMLAIMEDTSHRHPRIEHLFTTSEETGMDGAHGLDPKLVKGRRLINLDTEEFGEIYISCAGGADSLASVPTPRAAADVGAVTLELAIGGLLGGHSGLDIHLRRGNAIKVLARALRGAQAAAPIRIRSIGGGAKRNAIAEKSAVTFDVAADSADDVRAAIDAVRAEISAELTTTDPDFSARVEAAAGDGPEPMTAAATAAAIDLLIALPDGVLAMSPDVPGLVETSCNLGTLVMGDAGMEVCVLTRSALDSAVETVKERVRTIARLCGGKVEEPLGYPGWKPDPDSELLAMAKSVYREIFGADPEIKAVHAGLECGLLGEKLPGSDMISIGPTMANVHTPAEELYIPHVAETDRLLWGILDALANG